MLNREEAFLQQFDPSYNPSYIKLPVSFAYLVKLGEILASDRKYESLNSYSIEQIESLMREGEVKKDFDRTLWRINSNTIRSDQLKEENPFSLSNEQNSIYDALHVFATSSTGEPLQGGMFAWNSFVFTLWLKRKILAGTEEFQGDTQRINTLKQNKEETEQLVISYSYDCSLEPVYYRNLNLNLNLIRVHSEYEITCKDSKFTCQQKSGSYSAEIIKDYWEQVILPYSLDYLAKNKLTVENVYLLVPFLSDPSFRQAFLKKLRETPANASLLEATKKGIRLCFNVNIPFLDLDFVDSFWQRHKGKVLSLFVFAIAGLFLYGTGVGWIAALVIATVFAAGTGMAVKKIPDTEDFLRSLPKARICEISEEKKLNLLRSLTEKKISPSPSPSPSTSTSTSPPTSPLSPPSPPSPLPPSPPSSSPPKKKPR